MNGAGWLAVAYTASLLFAYFLGRATVNEPLSDYETCSWCTTEVLDSTLTETDNGRLCRDCLEASK